MASSSPLPGLSPVFGRGADALTIWTPLHSVVAQVHHGLGVASITAGRNLLAADPWIKRVIGPLDLRVFGHHRTSAAIGISAPTGRCQSRVGASAWPLLAGRRGRWGL